MKTKLMLVAVLMMSMLVLPSFSSGKSSAQALKAQQKRTIIEFGDYYYMGDWYFVYGDPATGEVTDIIPFGITPGGGVASWSGNCIFVGSGWVANFTVTPLVGSPYYVGDFLVFA